MLMISLNVLMGCILFLIVSNSGLGISELQASLRLFVLVILMCHEYNEASA